MHGARYFILIFPGALPSYTILAYMDDTTIMESADQYCKIILL